MTAKALSLAAYLLMIPQLHAQETVGLPGPLRFGPLYTSGLANPPAPTVFRHVESAVLGASWPLAAADAYVGCARSRPRTSALVVVEGVPWTLNAETRSAVEKIAQELDVDGRRQRIRPSMGNEDWVRGNPDPELAGAKMSLVPLLTIAQRLGCLPRSPGSR